MLGTSTFVGSSGDGGTSAHEGGRSGGGGVGGSEAAVGPQSSSIIMTRTADDEKARSATAGGGDLFESDRSTGGNRWPRQETIALLQIRSDMDVTFRDSSLKGPLWEEVSRKMAELGYHRSAKKCKEKFENVYKYHKRTKDGRVGKADGKTYRFFDQLEALEQHHHLSITQSSSLPPLPLPQPPAQVTAHAQSQAPPQAAVPVSMVIPAGTNNNPAGVTVPSSPHPIGVVHTTSSIGTTPQQQINAIPPSSNPAVQLQSPQPQIMQQQHPHPHPHQHQQQQHQHSATMAGIPTHSSIQMENPSSPSATQSSSSSTSSDEELMGRRKRKRKWKDYFERLMKEVINKQEELQKRFLEAVEKREHDRVAREEAWKMQEMARLNREHDILVQERSMAAAKDAALISFLQKLSDQQQVPLPLPVQAQAQAQTKTPTQPQGQINQAAPVVASPPAPITQQQPSQPQTQTQPQPPPPPQTQQPPQQPPQMQPQIVQPQPQPLPQSRPQPVPPPAQPQPLMQPQPVTQLPQQTPPHLQQAIVVANSNNGDKVDIQKSNNGDNLLQAGSSRWPKAEVEALINLRTRLDQKYQENGPKGPLWEEISASMKKLGYNRNAKRCKEKWENINKYFKKVKESNKKRPEDSKTCPYFHQLDALYREKNKMEIMITTTTATTSPSFSSPTTNPGSMLTYGQPQLKHEGSSSASMAPIMAQPEQQWPPIQTMEDQGSENQDDSEDDDHGDEEEEDDDDDQGNGYEIVANNNNNNNVNA